MAGGRPEDLDPVRRGALVAFGHHEVETGEITARDRAERHLAVEPRDVGETLRRGDHVGLRAGLAVAPRVLAGVVDLEAVGVVLDRCPP